MDGRTLFGLAAVSAMLLFYASKIAVRVGSLPKASTMPGKRSAYSAPWRE